MTREDYSNETAEMDVDEYRPEQRKLSVPIKGFQPDYLRVFYGEIRFLTSN